MSTASPAISRRFTFGEHVLTLTMRRGATADMVQDTLWHLNVALSAAIQGVFFFSAESVSEFHNRTDYGESPHEQSRVNVWGELMVDIGGTHVLISVNQCDEYTSAQDILDLIGEFAAAASENAMLIENPLYKGASTSNRISTVDDTQIHAKNAPVASIAEIKANGETITLGEKEYFIAPPVLKFSELPAYKKDELVAFKVVKIKRTIGKLKSGDDKEVWEFYTKGGGKYPLFKIWGNNKMLDFDRPLRNELPGLAFAEDADGQWYVTGHANEYQGKLSIWFTHCFKVGK